MVRGGAALLLGAAAAVVASALRAAAPSSAGSVGQAAPTEGWDQAPAEGWDQAPAEGWEEAPAEGWGEAPAEGWGEAPAEVWEEAPVEGWEEAPQLLEQPSDRPQGPMGHLLVPNRSYVFMAHRKTGTNLMVRLAELTSQMAFGDIRTHFCLRVYKPEAGSVHPTCVIGVDGSRRIDAPMDTVISTVSNINGKEMKDFLDAVPNTRVVHMVRDPKKIAISDYQYEMFLHSPDTPESMKYDTLLPDANFSDASSIMRTIARETHSEVEEITSTNSVVAGDPRVLTIDLDSIAGNYDSFSARMYNHLFDNPPLHELNLLSHVAAVQDVSRWKQEQFSEVAVTAASRSISRREALEAWEALQKAGDKHVLQIMSDSRSMGY